ncbi:Transposon Ty3-I Gag-Pol polyprotein [Echinococcus granulosus]|uniref:Transposon Ty3-I Gag-Pol polyprotein n=1 Tax=Echinococcus granulosus TaxID=6210 RepID=W6UZS2_ECHGR|nr:Transposon Ty3-I Gag-Pol polyprotein [Echinococcus granulosus]EUB64047.1 Transposon Ty3-I Gag-Pol polyprotein [Echinococcus granulosus]
MSLRPTLVAAPVDIPPFGEDMNFEDWLLTAKFNLPLYPHCQRIPLILRALPHALFVAAVGVGITHDTDVDQCWDTLAQLVMDCEERFQKADKADKEVRPSALAEKLCEAKTNSLDQLVKLATKKRQELRVLPIFRKPQNLSISTSLHRASPRYTPRPATGASTDTSLPKDDADDICNALFEVAAISMKNLDDLCAQLTHIFNYERKELRQLLLKHVNIFSWQGARLGRTNIVKHKIGTGEARPIWQPPRRIPPPLLEEINRPVEEMLRDEVIKPSKSPWASSIALVKKNDGNLRLCIDYRKLNAVTKKDAFPFPT